MVAMARMRVVFMVVSDKGIALEFDNTTKSAAIYE
jgi:hypothetical protein